MKSKLANCLTDKIGLPRWPGEGITSVFLISVSQVVRKISSLPSSTLRRQSSGRQECLPWMTGQSSVFRVFRLRKIPCFPSSTSGKSLPEGKSLPTSSESSGSGGYRVFRLPPLGRVFRRKRVFRHLPSLPAPEDIASSESSTLREESSGRQRSDTKTVKIQL